MRLFYSDIYNKFRRNIQSLNVVDSNLDTEFNYQLGVYYQLMLAKLKNYKTYISSNFYVGMYLLDLTTGAAAIGISSVTVSGGVATVTTGLAHGLTNGDSVAINNTVAVINGVVLPNPNGLNGVFTVTVLTSTTFTYSVSSSLNGSSALATQYFPNPPGYVTADGIVITVNQLNYPLKLVSSESVWEQLNAVRLQASAVPQFYYPRRDDFGVWPIPQNLYVGTIYYHYRDRNLMVPDYTGGNIAVTQNSNIVTGSAGAAFTPAMVGRWFTIDDLTVPGRGYFYRVTGYTNATHVTLAQPYQGSNASSISAYRIGESPEIPEDLHMYLPDGVTGGYYKDLRKDAKAAQLFLNNFWTGDMNNTSRKEGDENIAGGLLGGMKNYSDREDERVINRKPGLNPLQYKAFATTLAPGT